MALTREQVAHVARLARLSLTDSELAAYTDQLSRIIEHVESLNQADTADVPPTYHAIDLQNVFRPDEPCASVSRERLLEQAPEAEAGCFKVPKITEG